MTCSGWQGKQWKQLGQSHLVNYVWSHPTWDFFFNVYCLSHFNWAFFNSCPKHSDLRSIAGEPLWSSLGGLQTTSLKPPNRHTTHWYHSRQHPWSPETSKDPNAKRQTFLGAGTCLRSITLAGHLLCHLSLGVLALASRVNGSWTMLLDVAQVPAALYTQSLYFLPFSHSLWVLPASVLVQPPQEMLSLKSWMGWLSLTFQNPKTFF